MTVSSHINELEKKHAHLTRQVEDLQRSPAGDDLAVSELKKKKLMLKEEIGRLSN
jgi:hypothetical protein